jgi:site-specific recombinase XerD
VYGCPGRRLRIAAITRESFSAMTTTAIQEVVRKGRCRSDAQKVRSSTHLFRKAFVSNLRREGADADAVEHLVGHDIGVKAHYLDLDRLMLAAVKKVPEMTVQAAEETEGENAAEESNVISLPAKG